MINLQDTIELDELLSDEFPEATWADRHFIQDKKEAAGWSLPDPIPETPIQQWLNDEVWPRRVARIDVGLFGSLHAERDDADGRAPVHLAGRARAVALARHTREDETPVEGGSAQEAA